MKILGIDGCRFGWLGILIDNKGNWDYLVCESLTKLLLHFNPDACLIDIPIVLSENESARNCDIALRKLLPKNYKSSVFNPPVYNALNAQDYKEACKLNHFATGKKISLQTWYILPKIIEVNEFIQANDEVASKFFESHPETFFFRLNNENPLQNKKKTLEGRLERLSILMKLDKLSQEIYNSIVSATLRKHVQFDDILDAIVLALAGIKHFTEMFEMIPDEPILDDRGGLQNVFIPKKLPQ
jgi:predicted RNase H-like nuclease